MIHDLLQFLPHIAASIVVSSPYLLRPQYTRSKICQEEKLKEQKKCMVSEGEKVSMMLMTCSCVWWFCHWIGRGEEGVNLPVKFSVSAEVPAPQQEMLGARSWIFSQFLSHTIWPAVALVSAPRTTPSWRNSNSSDCHHTGSSLREDQTILLLQPDLHANGLEQMIKLFLFFLLQPYSARQKAWSQRKLGGHKTKFSLCFFFFFADNLCCYSLWISKREEREKKQNLCDV